VRKRLGFLAIVILIACGMYAWRTKRAFPSVSPTRNPSDVQVQLPAKSGMPGSGRLKKVPYTGPAFDPNKKYPPGEYIPKSFAKNFREQIKMDFGDAIDFRLGKDFPVEKRKAASAVQDKFWDEHGPDVDLFAEGKISQPEFAERTHLATTHFMDGMGKIFSDAEYVKLFDLPKDVDAFYQLYHSADEQPGMPMKPEDTHASGAPLPQAPGAAPPEGAPATAGYSAPQPGQSKSDVYQANPHGSSGSGVSPSVAGHPAPAPAPLPAK